MMFYTKGQQPTHSLERTSPKGEPFVGTCRLCGTSGLPSSALNDPCPNQRELTAEEALVETVLGTPARRGAP